MKEYINRLRPFINIECNRLCSNVMEADVKKISGISWEQIYMICGNLVIDGETVKKFRNRMLRSDAFGEVSGGSLSCIVVNPKYFCESENAKNDVLLKMFFEASSISNKEVSEKTPNHGKSKKNNSIDPSSDMYGSELYCNCSDIIMINRDVDENYIIRSYDNALSVSMDIGSSENSVKKVLDGKVINSSVWKPNIFYKNIDDDFQYRYIIVYKKDWISYSKRQKDNRIHKLIYQDID